MNAKKTRRQDAHRLHSLLATAWPQRTTRTNWHHTAAAAIILATAAAPCATASAAYTNNNGSGSYPAFSTVVNAINQSAAQIGIANDATVGTSTVGELPAIRGNTANQTGVLASTASINYHAFYDQNNQWSVFQQQYSQNPWWMMGNGMPYYATGTLNEPSTYQSVFIDPNTGGSDFSFTPTYTNSSGNQKGTATSVFKDGNGNSLFYNALTEQSDFAYNPDAAAQNLANALQPPTAWQEATEYNNSWPVFTDKYGASAFVQPTANTNLGINGGLSYFAQLNYDTGITSNSPKAGLSSVFKDEYGPEESVSVFSGRNNWEAWYMPNHNQTYPQQGIWDSAFQTQAQAITGTETVPLGSSVFLTDNPNLTGPQGNPDIGHSVFLDPEGNSYLDDIAAALTWQPNYDMGQFYNSSLGGSIPQPYYTSFGALDWQFYNQYGNGSLNSMPFGSQVSASLPQLLSYAYGITETQSGYLTAPYNFITTSSFQQAPGETPAEWYQGPDTPQGVYTNMFAEAFYNAPDANGNIKPYLATFSGLTSGQLSQTTIQQNTQSSALSASSDAGYMVTQLTQDMPSATSSSGSYTFNSTSGTGAYDVLKATRLTQPLQFVTNTILNSANASTESTGIGAVASASNTDGQTNLSNMPLYGGIQQPSNGVSWTGPGFTSTSSSDPDGEVSTIGNAFVAGLITFSTGCEWLQPICTGFYILWILVATVKIFHWSLWGGELPFKLGAPSNED